MLARVLVVDDEELVRRSLCQLLAALGYQAAAAASGEAALVELAARRSEVVLLDQRMPGLSGTETWDRIARSIVPAPAPVLMTAAAAGALLAQQHGMAFLGKPFTLEELSRVLVQVLAARR